MEPVYTQDIQLHEAKSSKIKSSNYIQYLTSQKTTQCNISSLICIIIRLILKAYLSTEPNVVYTWNLGDDNEKLPNKTCIMAQLNILKGQTERQPLCSFCGQESCEPYQI